jgi:tRNA(Ile)-lysidine synthase
MRGATTRAVRFDATLLARQLARFAGTGTAAPTRYVVAWSGGADSTALLAALCEWRDLRPPSKRPSVAALHVDHGLQAASTGWARHCRRLARQWRVPLMVRRVEVSRIGASPEAAARAARYAAFEAGLRTGDVLLLAQHARDQLETLLLQLLRGAGPLGLAAMPASRPLGRARLLRPLLEVPPEALHDYLRRRGLSWVEDPTNVIADADRNYLRAEVLPRLRSRWPAVLRTSGRSARLLREAADALGRHAQRDLRAVADGEGLSLPLLRRFADERVAAVLRAWFAARGAPWPDQARLAQMVRVLALRDDAQPLVSWADVELRRHQDRLLLVRRAAVPAPARDIGWRWARPLALPGGTLRVVADRHGELDLARLPAEFAVRMRAAGRASAPEDQRIDVKSLLRESGIPSWRRAELPFLHDPRAASVDASLLAIADLWHANAMRATPASRRRGRIVWQPV